jgi:Tfp pilus assembly protein PilO
VSITDRDRKILMALIPIALIAAYWFLLLAPKREESTAIQDQLTTAQTARDTAVQQASNLSAAKRSFATDYAAVIQLGKSIPSTVDMPSLMVQLDRAARGTGINFTSIQPGERTAAAASTSTGGSSSTPTNGGTGPANSSTPAQSGAGAAAQNAGTAVNTSNANSAAAGASQPATGATGATGSTPASTALDSVPLDFQFDGSFYDMADFFHRMKRFVRVANDRIVVRGRLMTINSFTFDSKETFPSLKVTVHATVYLAPKAQGVAAGATPDAPAGATPGGTSGQTASAQPSSSPTPAATVTTR